MALASGGGLGTLLGSLSRSEVGIFVYAMNQDRFGDQVWSDFA
jgi:hypothetical protein